MKSSLTGTLVGLILGLSLAFGSFGQMLIVGLIGLIGFVVGKVTSGELDLSKYLSGRQSR